MKEFNFHVKPIGLLDMLHFKTLVPNRQKKLSQGSLEPVTSVYKVNRLASFLHPRSQRATVSEVIEHGDIAKTYILSGTGLAPFRAGQYVSVRLNINGSVLTRPYSISSSPAWVKEGKYAITVKRTAENFASGWILENWKAGTEVSMSGPEGTFYYEPLRDARHVIGVAGGSGITPFLSMAYAIRDGIEDFELTILYGSRCEADILFREELEAIARECEKVKIANVLSDEQNERFDCGFITAELISKYVKDKPYSLFLCGPAAMYAFLEKEIEKLSLERKYVRRELMAAPSSPAGIKGYPGDETKVYSLTVNMFGNTQTIPMKACETVLTALERAGINAPSRCRSGECGWCRSLLQKGEAFTPAQFDGRRMADIKTGHIHPCCAYPLSDLTIEIWPEQEG
jgi:ferredoxin-NADP reductase